MNELPTGNGFYRVYVLNEILFDFLLFKWGEVSRYSKDTLRLYIKYLCIKSRVRKFTLEEYYTEDMFYIVNVKNENLPFLLTIIKPYGRRLRRNSIWFFGIRDWIR